MSTKNLTSPPPPYYNIPMNTNRRIIAVLIFICFLFLSLIVYLTYFAVFRSAELVASPHNRRNWVSEESTMRGTIYDATGIVLARSTLDSEGNQIREYPHGSLYAHVIGYNSPLYGRSQLEASFNDLLLGRTRLAGLMGLGGEAEVGFDLILTIDHQVQQVASRQLGRRTGAAVAIDPRSGAIIAMVSYPTFDPNEAALVRNWVSINEDANSPLVPRATSGLYEPGSSFKIVTAAALLANGLGHQTINDQGHTTIAGQRFQNFRGRAMGNINLSDAFVRSSNVAFVEWGAELGGAELQRTAERFGFGRAITTDLPVAASRFPRREMTASEIAAASIGQWEVQSTPLNMARVAGIIANGGRDIPLHVVDRATNSAGAVVYDARRVPGARIISARHASEIQQMMRRAVNDASGTGGNARLAGTTVAGKTGTAETNIAGRTHAWFVGYAPADNPRVAVAVVFENSTGMGGDLAAPVAREIIRAALAAL